MLQVSLCCYLPPKHLNMSLVKTAAAQLLILQVSLFCYLPLKTLKYELSRIYNQPQFSSPLNSDIRVYWEFLKAVPNFPLSRNSLLLWSSHTDVRSSLGTEMWQSGLLPRNMCKNEPPLSTSTCFLSCRAE